MENQAEDRIGSLFSLAGQTALVLGGSGVLGAAMARELARAGARVAVVGRRLDACESVARQIEAEGGTALALAADALDRESLRRAAAEVRATLGGWSILVNAFGGNAPAATTGETSFFELDPAAVEAVVRANFAGVVQACQVLGRAMVEGDAPGAIVNIASMAALRPLTRVAAYSAAKSAVVNFTQWLAVHLAQEYGARLRVNAIAPGFFLTEQNRYLLTDEATGGWTARGHTILDHTPMRRLGEPDDLVGTLLWLVSPASAFVTGVVVPVDGGFAAYGGV
jgi:NAD(P)-dependent dehydrogenase (short-subunit alcohol dehydrogenase family)